MSFPREYFTGARSWRVLRCAILIVSLSLLQTFNVLFAQSEPSQLPQTTPPLVANDTIAEDLQRLTNRVLQLEIDLAKASKTPTRSDAAVTTAIIAGSATLVAALLAGGLTLLGQQFMAKREER